MYTVYKMDCKQIYGGSRFLNGAMKQVYTYSIFMPGFEPNQPLDFSVFTNPLIGTSSAMGLNFKPVSTPMIVSAFKPSVDTDTIQTNKPTVVKPLMVETTFEPIVGIPKRIVVKPLMVETTFEPIVGIPKRIVVKPLMVETTFEPIVGIPVTKPTVTKPTVTKPTVTKPTVTKPTVTKPTVTKPTTSTEPDVVYDYFTEYGVIRRVEYIDPQIAYKLTPVNMVKIKFIYKYIKELIRYLRQTTHRTNVTIKPPNVLPKMIENVDTMLYQASEIPFESLGEKTFTTLKLFRRMFVSLVISVRHRDELMSIRTDYAAMSIQHSKLVGMHEHVPKFGFNFQVPDLREEIRIYFDRYGVPEEMIFDQVRMSEITAELAGK